jgi:hypothetical protein
MADLVPLKKNASVTVTLEGREKREERRTAKLPVSSLALSLPLFVSK